MSFYPKDLYITREDFQMLSGMNFERIYASRPPRFPYVLLFFLLVLFFTSAAIASTSSQNSSMTVIAYTSLLLFIIVFATKILDARQLEIYETQKSLRALLLEVQKYNIIVQAFDVRTQLDSIRYKEDFSEDWYTLWDALEITHENLIASLKIERILRENKMVLEQNPSLLADNLMGLELLDIEHKASEWGNLFDEAMEVAIAVRNEMQSLSRYDLPKDLH